MSGSGRNCVTELTCESKKVRKLKLKQQESSQNKRLEKISICFLFDLKIYFQITVCFLRAERLIPYIVSCFHKMYNNTSDVKKIWSCCVFNFQYIYTKMLNTNPQTSKAHTTYHSSLHHVKMSFNWFSHYIHNAIAFLQLI